MDNLTVVLDCCFAARGVTREGHLVPTLTEDASPKAERRTAIGDRVFCASGPDRSSYQAMLGGYWYSAFTWALTVTLEQWEMETDGGVAESTVSHDELLFRARTLMRALGFRQHPVFEDGAGLGNQRVFHLGSGRSRPAVGSPNAPRESGQLQPDIKLMIHNGGDTSTPVLAEVFVVGANKTLLWSDGTSFTPRVDTECWFVDEPNFAALNDTALTIVAADITYGSRYARPASTSSFSCAVGDGVAWSTSPTRYNGTSHYYNYLDMGLELNVSTRDGVTTLNGVQWWYLHPSYSQVLALGRYKSPPMMWVKTPRPTVTSVTKVSK